MDSNWILLGWMAHSTKADQTRPKPSPDTLSSRYTTTCQMKYGHKQFISGHAAWARQSTAVGAVQSMLAVISSTVLYGRAFLSFPRTDINSRKLRWRAGTECCNAGIWLCRRCNRENVVLFSARNTNSHGWNITGRKWQITSSSCHVDTIHDLRRQLELYFG